MSKDNNREKVQAEAKEKAIDQAKAKAKATAKSLGVSLGSISQFNDEGAYNPSYYRAEVMSVKASGAAMDSVSIPTGESVIKARVSITYTLE